MTLLAGIECDILPDGRLDLADGCLAELDFVIAPVHSALQQDEARMTDRLLCAITCPWVDAIAHPTGRLILRREPSRANMERVFEEAAAQGVALEWWGISTARRGWLQAEDVLNTRPLGAFRASLRRNRR